MRMGPHGWVPSLTWQQTIEDMSLFLDEDTPATHRPQMLIC